MSQVAKVIEGLFNIYNKEGILVPFKLNQVQSLLDIALIENGVLRSSILKFRQGGVTSFIMAWFLIECMSKHASAVMIAHDRDHTEKLLQRAQLFLKNVKGNLKPKTSKMNESEIFFPKTDSSFYIGTAGSRDFGRSATITHLHCSEIAFWRDPKNLLIGLLQAVPKETGIVVQETTGNGWGSWFQKRYYGYKGGVGGFKPLFLPWYMFDEYSSKTSLLSPPTEEEGELMNKFNLTLPQIQWRREKIDEFEGDKSDFHQEYPASVEEAFKLSRGSLFPNLELSTSEDWKEDGSNTMRLFSHPKKGYTYILGSDASGGTGNDNASINIICLETLEQVYRYSCNRIQPPQFAKFINEIGRLYNNAYIVQEANSHGISVLAILKDIYPRDKLYKRIINKGRFLPNTQINIPSYGWGWQTSTTSKPYMVGLAQSWAPRITLYDSLTLDELTSFSETDEGKLEGVGEHDDIAISFMLCCVGLNKLLRMHPELEDRKVEVEKVEIKKPSFRDEEGRYLLPFKVLFENKKSWRTHVIS